MLALLGLVAVAGYQNRDKISEMLKGVDLPRGDGTLPDNQGSGGGLLSGLGDLLGGGAAAGGLGELIDRFRQNGQGEVADSWVTTGPNRGLAANEVETAIGAQNLEELSRRTGLTPAELVERLSTRLPGAIDELTPDGRLPS